MNVYYVRPMEVDDYGYDVYPRINYVDLYSTRERAQVEADRENEATRRWFEQNEERRLAEIERENAKQVALEKAGFEQARLRKTERRTFNPPFVVEEAEVYE